MSRLQAPHHFAIGSSRLCHRRGIEEHRNNEVKRIRALRLYAGAHSCLEKSEFGFR
jgi:hypothetical protein